MLGNMITLCYLIWKRTFKWPKMKLCDNFGCSTSDHIEGICGHTNKQTDRQFVYYNKMQSIKGDM